MAPLYQAHEEKINNLLKFKLDSDVILKETYFHLTHNEVDFIQTGSDGSIVIGDFTFSARKCLYSSIDSIVPAWRIDVLRRSEVSSYTYVISATDGSVLHISPTKKDLSSTFPSTEYEIEEHPISQKKASKFTTESLITDETDGVGLVTDMSNPNSTLYCVFASQSGLPLNPTSYEEVNQSSADPQPMVSLWIASGPINTKDPWLPSNSLRLIGNNVNTTLDTPIGRLPINSTNNRTFCYFQNYTLSTNISVNASNIPTPYYAAAVQSFYTLNWLHDEWYNAGFNEGNGNAQNRNMNRGGLAGDPILAIIHTDAGGCSPTGRNPLIFNTSSLNTTNSTMNNSTTNNSSASNNTNVITNPNAFIASRNCTVPGTATLVTPDGISPEIHLYFRLGSNLTIPAAFDPCSIAHEFGTILAERLAGDGSVLSNIAGRAISSGVADFLCVMSTLRPKHANSNGQYRLKYVVGSWFDQKWGLRRYPYTVHMGDNPLTYKYVTPFALPATITSNPRAEYGPNYLPNLAGEVWATALFECYITLLESGIRYVDAKKALQQYIVNSLHTLPPNPGFLQARDLLLIAANASNPAHYKLLQRAFAKRGFGKWANEVSSINGGVIESFTVDEPNYGLHVRIKLGEDSCNQDGVLSDGETIPLQFGFVNTGTLPLYVRIMKIESPTHTIKLGALPSGNVGSNDSFWSLTPLRVEGANFYDTLRLTIWYTGESSNGTVQVSNQTTWSTPINYNLAQASMVETFSQLRPVVWTALPRMSVPDTRGLFGLPTTPASIPANAPPPAGGWQWSWADPLGTEATGLYILRPPINNPMVRLVSPRMQVTTFENSTTGVAFVIQHRHDFDPLLREFGSLLVKIEGTPGWIDVTANCTETGNLNIKTSFNGLSSNYPRWTQTTCNLKSLTSVLLGKTIRIQFRFSTSIMAETGGWWIDSVTAYGIINAPFPTPVMNAPGCNDYLTQIEKVNLYEDIEFVDTPSWEVHGCDEDGILDALPGEYGLLKFSLLNTGSVVIDPVITISSPNALLDISLQTVGLIQPGETKAVRASIRLKDVKATRLDLDLRISVTSTVRKIQLDYRRTPLFVNYDLVGSSSLGTDFRINNTFEFPINETLRFNYETTDDWEETRGLVLKKPPTYYLTCDSTNCTNSTAVSPVLQFSGTSITFQFSTAFDFGETEGGIVQLGIGNMPNTTWINLDSFISPSYPAVIPSRSSSPLRGFAVLSGSTQGMSRIYTVNITGGTLNQALGVGAGYIRFLYGADPINGRMGYWRINSIVFWSSLTTQPFFNVTGYKPNPNITDACPGRPTSSVLFKSYFSSEIGQWDSRAKESFRLAIANALNKGGSRLTARNIEVVSVSAGSVIIVWRFVDIFLSVGKTVDELVNWMKLHPTDMVNNLNNVGLPGTVVKTDIGRAFDFVEPNTWIDGSRPRCRRCTIVDEYSPYPYRCSTTVNGQIIWAASAKDWGDIC
eukprot:NODE_37_length_4622_cov_20.694821_g30_i0.p1 GENE.NODE_37_length_4622_cov_20.694821_g30_i0~~NODE_37_length_4622_cov_20.694821_g30_i0.p1  ORF type:complete len:1501 (+),score=319.74 NODE_37_length_4622_cov_20.694821_g30_i0:107-4504(+)